MSTMEHERWLHAGPRRERRDRAIADAYKSGARVGDIAAAFGLTRTTISSVLNAMSVKRRPPAAPEHLFKLAKARAKRQAARNKAIAAAYRKGATQSDLAETYGVTRQRIQQIVAVPSESAGTATDCEGKTR